MVEALIAESWRNRNTEKILTAVYYPQNQPLINICQISGHRLLWNKLLIVNQYLIFEFFNQIIIKIKRQLVDLGNNYSFYIRINQVFWDLELFMEDIQLAIVSDTVYNLCHWSKSQHLVDLLVIGYWCRLKGFRKMNVNIHRKIFFLQGQYPVCEKIPLCIWVLFVN